MRICLNVADDSLGVKTFVNDTIDSVEERELVDHASCRKEFMHFLSSKSTLQLLAIEQFSFQLFNRLTSLGECFSNLTITTSRASSDQIGNTTRFKEGFSLDNITKEGLTKFTHFHKTTTNDSSLGIAP